MKQFWVILLFVSAQLYGQIDVDSESITIDELYSSQPESYRPIILDDYDLPVDYSSVSNCTLIITQDNPNFAEKDFNDYHWTPISVNTTWETLYPDYEGIAWYRIHITLPEDLPERELGIRLGKISLADETYLNGHLIGAEGSFNPPKNNAHEMARIYLLPSKYINFGGDNVIAIRVKGGYHNGSGLVSGDYKIDYYTDMIRGFYHQSLQHFVLIIAYLVIATYFLLFFVRRPQEKDYLFFGLFALTLAIYSFLRSDLRFILHPDQTLLKQIEFIVLFTMVPFFTAFIIEFFKRKHHVVHYVFYILSAIASVSVIIFPVPYFWNRLNFLIMQPLWLIGIATIIYILFAELKKKRDAKIMIGSVLLILIAAVNDILVARMLLSTPLLLTYAFFFVVVSFALILANKFVRLHNEVEELNVNLEKKVEKRTAQVRSLIEQQNGDYFLTSRLIQPLITNEADSEAAKVDFYLDQKKKFSFKHWESELGGDICISHSIELNGRKYLAFLNGDAMGKSMQGAGGSLILGTLFNSFVEQTLQSEAFRRLKPGEWLRDCYQQMESVFEEFDGGMMISAVIGLLEESTGKISYFNQEHPWIVLYRNGVPTFADDRDKVGRKIGTIGFSGMTLQTLQLKPGDVLFTGSDGRDDLLLSRDEETGQRIINEDETLFLKLVKNADGNLEKLVDLLRESGEFTDDLSLLRIEFIKPVKDKIKPVGKDDVYIEELETINREKEKKDLSERYKILIKRMDRARVLYKQKDYHSALTILKELHGQFQRSAEKFELRNLLGHCYFKLKNYEKTLEIWEEADRIQPGNPTLNKNIKSLQDFLK